MHVVVLENCPSSQLGGKELSLLDVCRGLHQKGHHISLVYFQAGDLLADYQQFCLTTLQAQATRLQMSALPGSMAALWSQTQSVTQAIHGALADHPTGTAPSLVYIDQDRGSLLSILLAIRLRVPAIFHLRQPFFADVPLQEKISFKFYKTFIAVSEQTRKDWTQAGIRPEKVAVVHNGTHLDRFTQGKDPAIAKAKYGLSPQDRVISYVGRIDPEKGLESLLKGFARLQRQTDASLRLLIAGKPVCHRSVEAGQQYLQDLKNLALSEGIGEQVSFLGHLSDVMALYHASDVAVLPSINSEPFGKTVIEAMASGVPVVASQTGGIPEILTGDFSQGLFPPGDVGALADSLGRVLQWRLADPQLSQSCRDHVVEQFSIAATLDKIEQVMVSTL